MNSINKTFGNYTDASKPLLNNYFLAALAGTIWFMQFFFYGMGESKLGNGASSWILHMATIILTANFWGFYRKEWKGVKQKTIRTILTGIILILLSVIIVGIGNSVENLPQKGKRATLKKILILPFTVLLLHPEIRKASFPRLITLMMREMFNLIAFGDDAADIRK